MDKSSNYVFLPSFSLEPNKVTSYNSVFIKNNINNTIKSIHEFKKPKIQKAIGINDNNSVVKSKHNFNISDNAYRTLKRKISWLYYLAKSKQVVTSNGKSIYNFKIGFLTLTLPSEQKHPTSFITKNLLNNFLTEIRAKTQMENYIWRLEFQKNGNVHYHIVTDTYLDYEFTKKIWNRILYNYGYIQPYQKKFSSMSLHDYNKLTNSQNKIEFGKIAQTYFKGKACNWSQPPTIDLKSVISNKAISNYISKYFAKSSDSNPIQNKLDNDENSSNIRLWFCSRSLSKLKTISNFCEAVNYDIFSIVSFCPKVKKVFNKYATTIYFEIKDMLGNARKWIELILKNYAKENNYLPASNNYKPLIT